MSLLHILDTDTLSFYERGQKTVSAKVSAVPPNQVAVAIITAEEQMVGRLAYLRRAKGDKEVAFAYQMLTDSVRSLSDFHIITFSEAAIIRYNLLLAMNLNVGKMDLRIAAIALEEGAAVITRNLRDFQRVPELNCENWVD